MVLTESALTHLAATTLETDLEDSLTLACDALREILNITCGKVIQHLAGPEYDVRHGLPEVASCGWWGWEDLLNAPETHPFLLPNDPILVQLQLNAGFWEA
jgi:hypothetical protein